MPFQESIFNPLTPRHRIERCTECGHKFRDGEPYFKRWVRRSAGIAINGYLCARCYENLFIDL